MSPEKQRIAIATACGWTRFNNATHKWAILYGQPPNAQSNSWELPHFLTDLNAMHAAEKILTGYQQTVTYSDSLMKIVGYHTFDSAHATAAQRSEAFLRTLGLWEEDAQ